MDQKVKSGRILGIDYGTKRVGIAVSDETMKFALPVKVIQNGSGLVIEIKRLAEEYQTKKIVIGESRNYKGEPNAIFPAVEKCKSELESEGFTIMLEPEFMTSVQAERLQGKNDMSDASAAALILQSYLDKETGR